MGRTLFLPTPRARAISASGEVVKKYLMVSAAGALGKAQIARLTDSASTVQQRRVRRFVLRWKPEIASSSIRKTRACRRSRRTISYAVF
jgi:hypothetical protein